MTAAQAQLAEFNAVNAAVRAARESGDHAALLTNVRKLAALAAGHPGLQVGLARALALNGDGAGAVAQLNRVADLGLSFEASNDAAFQGLKDDPDFVAAAQRLADNGKGLGRGTAIIKLGLTGGSEGVAWSETSKSFLMGSSGAIHAYKLDGQAPARPVARAFGPQILGIRPDPPSRSYLVCVNEHDGSSSAVVRHHESNGGIMAIYRLPTRNALCNDIALLRNGSFAVTDSNNGAVFHLLDGKLEPLALTTPIYLPNGIASDSDKNRLYVAHAGGVVVHDLGTGGSRELAADRTLIGALDGMVWHKGALIGVQSLANARMDSRLLRITPDADAQAATVEVLLAGADFPGSSASTVALVGDEAFVIGRTTTRDSHGERVEPFLIRAPL
jgi:sugar lactone lactonase YvrE